MVNDKPWGIILFKAKSTTAQGLVDSGTTKLGIFQDFCGYSSKKDADAAAKSYNSIHWEYKAKKYKTSAIINNKKMWGVIVGQYKLAVPVNGLPKYIKDQIGLYVRSYDNKQRQTIKGETVYDSKKSAENAASKMDKGNSSWHYEVKEFPKGTIIK